MVSIISAIDMIDFDAREISKKRILNSGLHFGYIFSVENTIF
jgi:hypothetical protein